MLRPIISGLKRFNTSFLLTVRAFNVRIGIRDVGLTERAVRARFGLTEEKRGIEAYYEKRLTESEGRAYRAIRAAIREYRDEATFVEPTTYDWIAHVSDAFVYGCPEIFFVAFDKMVFEICGGRVKVKIPYQYSKSDVAQYADKMALAVAKLVRESGEYETVKAVHDFLAARIGYKLNAKRDEIHNLVGALLDNECVCDAYAEAAAVILPSLGIPCTVVHGSVSGDDGNKPGYAWNVVTVDGENYHMDVTNDDMENRVAAHSMFLISDDEMRETVFFDDDFGCHSNKNNFYVKENRIVRKRTDLAKIIARSDLNKPLEIKDLCYGETLVNEVQREYAARGYDGITYFRLNDGKCYYILPLSKGTGLGAIRQLSLFRSRRKF